MNKNIALTFFSILLIISCNTVNAVSCADTSSGVFDSQSSLNSIATSCLDANAKNDSEYALNSDKYFDVSTWSLLGKIKGGRGDISTLIDLQVDSVGSPTGTFSFDSSIWHHNDQILVVLKGGNVKKKDNMHGSRSMRGWKSSKHGSKGSMRSWKSSKHGSKGSMRGWKNSKHGSKGSRSGWKNSKHGSKGSRSGKFKKPKSEGLRWSAYLLDQDAYEGFWIFGEGRKGQWKDLSHLSVYGSGGDYNSTAVPVPAALWLFGSGLLALVAVSRRKPA